jgi:chloramphenicol-sensitive protein RarD
MKSYRYYLAGISAFFIWGFFSFVLKPLDHYASIDILFYRVFASVAILILTVLAFRKKQFLASVQFVASLDPVRKRRIIWQIVAGGILLTANWYLFIFVMNHISVKAASFAYLVCPILTALLAALILRENLSFIQKMAISISIISCVILAVGSVSDLLFSVLVALSYAFYQVAQPKHPEVDKVSVLMVQIICSALILVWFYPAAHGPVPSQSIFYLLILTIAVFFTIIPLLLNLYALQGLKSSTTGILIYINPLVGFLIAVIYFHEKITWIQVAGYSLMLVSIITFNWEAIARRPPMKGLRPNRNV